MVGGKVFYTLSDTEFGAGTRTHRSVDRKHPGLRPRWAVVVSVGTDAEAVGLKIGDKVLLDELKWSRGVTYEHVTRKKVWRIPVRDVLLVDQDGLTEQEKRHIKRRDRGEE